MNFGRAMCLLPAVLITSLAIDAQEKAPAQEVRISARPYLPTPAPAAALRVETDLIEVGVVVRSHDGHAIPGLKRENFAVTDQGHPRELSYFAIETPGIRGANPRPPPASPAGAAEPSQPAATPAAPAQPRFIALYFEDFGTNAGDLKHAQVAGRRFINEGLDDGDRVAMYSTSGDFLDYTGDKEKLIVAIGKLRAHPKFSESGTGCPRINAYQAYQIAVLFDPVAIDSALAEIPKCSSSDPTESYHPNPGEGSYQKRIIEATSEQTWGQVRVASKTTLDSIGGAMRSLQNKPGRRLFLMVSSGFNSGTLELERDRLISQALRSGIVINALDAKGLYSDSPGRPVNDAIETVGALPTQTFRFEAAALNSRLFLANQVMSDLAEATGGLFFHNNNDLPYGFRQLGSIPEVSYVLGFHRGDTAADGKYHKLKVGLVDTKPYLIQARPGYFAVKVAPAAAATAEAEPGPREKLDREVTSETSLADFVSSLAYQLANGAPNGAVTVKAQIHVALDKLEFPIRDERRVQQLTLIAALLDSKGNIVAAKEGTMDFRLTDATYARLSANGITAGLNLDAPPGRYRLRAVIQEAVDGKMASSSVEIEVK